MNQHLSRAHANNAYRCHGNLFSIHHQNCEELNAGKIDAKPELPKARHASLHLRHILETVDGYCRQRLKQDKPAMLLDPSAIDGVPSDHRCTIYRQR